MAENSLRTLDTIIRNTSVGEDVELKASTVETDLGTMISIVDDKHLYLLQFMSRINLKELVKKVAKSCNGSIVTGRNKISDQLEKELALYFKGKLETFKTPVKLMGTDFQRDVWNGLITTKKGDNITYMELAEKIDRASGKMAVYRAIQFNNTLLVIPCHRITNINNVGSYHQVDRKQWLIDHEN